jgi:VanZ family protein
MAAIFWLSSQSVLPGDGLIPDWLDVDWLHHGLAYAVLAVLAVRALAHGRWAGVGASALAVAWLIAMAYGATDEWHQSFVPGRMSDVRDLVADGVGAALGLSLVGAWSIIKRSS